MIKKTILLGMIVLSLLISATSFVSAESSDEVIDPQDDVYVITDMALVGMTDLDFSDFQKTDQKPNLDIVKVSYSRQEQSKEVTATIEVKGEIEDTGFNEEVLENMGEDVDEMDIWSMFSEPAITYSITIVTSEKTYTISYVNTYCIVSKSFYDSEKIDDYEKSGGRLTVSFDLNSTDETIKSISGNSQYTKFDLSSLLNENADEDDIGGEFYVDMAPDFTSIEVAAESDPSEAKVGEEIHFSAEIDADPSDYEWFWEFGDGEMSDEQNPTHTYSEPGDYDVTVAISTLDGSSYGSDATSVKITGSSDDGDDDSDDDSSGDTSDDTSGSDNSGNVAGTKTGKSSGSGLPAFIGLIAIIVIIGIAALVYIIRR